MQRYKVHASTPYQYLGGVGQFDVIYWPDIDRLILKFADKDGAYYFWDKQQNIWQDRNRQKTIAVTPDIHEVVMAMYECFAIAPVSGALTNGETK